MNLGDQVNLEIPIVPGNPSLPWAKQTIEWIGRQLLPVPVWSPRDQSISSQPSVQGLIDYLLVVRKWGVVVMIPSIRQEHGLESADLMVMERVLEAPLGSLGMDASSG